MASIEHYLDDALAVGRDSFSGNVARTATHQSAAAFRSAIKRAKKKRRVVSPWRNFFVVLRPEDRVAGAPDPIRWIDPLMRHLGIGYRVSLLRAAAFHGASRQAAMVFQVVAPKQLRSFEVGRHRIEFLYQSAQAFDRVNRPPWLSRIKSESGFATAAGLELTLLDCFRYLRRAGGLDAAAQLVHDLGGKARPRLLADAAESYPSAAVRRLGFLLERFGHARQAKALLPFAAHAKSRKPLDPAVRGLLAPEPRIDARWKLTLNREVEIDD